MHVLKGQSLLQLRKMEVKLSKARKEKVKKRANGNANQMTTAKMRESYAFVMAPVAYLALDLKENVPSYLTLPVAKCTSLEGTLIINFSNEVLDVLYSVYLTFRINVM